MDIVLHQPKANLGHKDIFVAVPLGEAKENCIFHLGKAMDQNARKAVQSANSKNIATIAKAVDEKNLRFLLDKSEVKYIYGLEAIHHKDHLHYRKGALDQVTCKLAKEKGITFVVSMAELLTAKNKAQFLGRVIANAKLCKKYKVPMLMVTFANSDLMMRSAADMKSFMKILGL